MRTDRPAIIRRATTEDAVAVASLGVTTFVETFGDLYTPGNLEAFLTRARSEGAYSALLRDPTVLVELAVTDVGEPIGYVVAGKCRLPVSGLEPEAGEVRELYVLAGHQGHGLGTRLLERALEWLEERGCSPLYVGVWSENYGAQRLYGRYGFEKVGEYEFPVGQQLDRELILKQRG